MLLRVKVFKQRKFKLGVSFAAGRRKALHYQFKLKRFFFLTIAATEIEVKEIQRICGERYGQNQDL